MSITAMNWTLQDTERLRHAIAEAIRLGEHYVMVKGRQFSVEYARHRLACLVEGQPDTVSDREAA